MESLHRDRVRRGACKPAGWMVVQLGPIDDAHAAFADAFLEADHAEFEWDLRAWSEAPRRADDRQAAVRAEARDFFHDAATAVADSHARTIPKPRPHCLVELSVDRIPVGKRPRRHEWRCAEAPRDERNPGSAHSSGRLHSVLVPPV